MEWLIPLELLLAATLALAVVGFAGCVTVAMLWNLFLLACRSLTPIARFGQAQPPIRLPAAIWFLAFAAWLFGLSLVLPGLMNQGHGRERNSSTQAKAHNIQMAVEQYALDHGGRYPATLREIFPAYMPGYPRTAWDTQQATKSDIPASYDPSVARQIGRVLGEGELEPPRLIRDFGAIGYTRLPDGRHYRLSATGKRGREAVVVFYQTNVSASFESDHPPPREPEGVSDTRISGQVPERPLER